MTLRADPETVKVLKVDPDNVATVDVEVTGNGKDFYPVQIRYSPTMRAQDLMAVLEAAAARKGAVMTPQEAQTSISKLLRDSGKDASRPKPEPAPILQEGEP